MMKQKRCILSFLLLLAFALVQHNAFAQSFSDDFDSYANGSELAGQGGWTTWNNDNTLGAPVSATQSSSVPHSVEIARDSDVVQIISGATSGTWVVSGKVYVPGNFSGRSYLVLLNTYVPIPSEPKNWSTQIAFDSASGNVESEFDASTLPLLTDQWVMVKVVIDLLTNTQYIYYGGSLLVEKSWTEGFSGGGAPELAALNLWANGATEVYWDDFSVSSLSASQSVPTLPEWSMILLSFLLVLVAYSGVHRKLR